MLEHSRNDPSVIYWPGAVRAVILPLGRAVREVWHGLDTWSGVTHGVIPLGGAEEEQLAVRGDVDALTARAGAGDEYAGELRARLQAGRCEAR